MIRLKRLLLLSVTLIFCFVSAIHAEPVDPGKAFKAAETYLSQTSPGGAQKIAGNAAIAQVKEITSANGETLAYIAELENGGFIILSSDTDVAPVLGYSTTGEFPYDDPKNNMLLDLVTMDMERRLKSIPVLEKNERHYVMANNAQWEKFTSGDRSINVSGETAAVWGPLLTTHWYQNSPYNDVCPLDASFGERSIVGCVATAMSQIVNYWKYPKQITFDSSDSYEKARYKSSTRFREARLPRISPK